MSLSELSFFGLTSEIAPQYRINLFTQIHEIVFHGNGGYDWDTVYNMPIRYRDFIYNQIREHFEKQNKEAEKQQKKINKKQGKANKLESERKTHEEEEKKSHVSPRAHTPTRLARPQVIIIIVFSFF